MVPEPPSHLTHHRVRAGLVPRSHPGLRQCGDGVHLAVGVFHHADLVALATERRDLMQYDPARNLPWPILDTPGAEVLPLESADLNSPARVAMSWRHQRDAFLERYRRLTADVMGVQAHHLDANLRAQGAAV